MTTVNSLAQNDEKDQLVHDFNQEMNSPLFSKQFLAALLAVLLLGVGTGYFLATIGKQNLGGGSSTVLQEGASIQKGAVVGSNDLKTFRDEAEGKLEEGGIEGEGQFHLVRPGGPSQYVYITSSIVDLSKLVGRKVRVWGETQKAQKAGWLMDVGRVEVLE